MGRPKEFDVELALEQALELFWLRGYEGTSMTELTSAMGIQKASLYDTYGDKRRLFISSLSRYSDEYFIWLQSIESAHESIFARIEEFVRPWVDETTGLGKGCFFVNTAIELAPHDPEIQAVIDQFVERIFVRLNSWIQVGIEKREITSTLSPDMIAPYLVSVRIGLCTLSNRKKVSEFTTLDDILATSLSPLRA